MLIVDNRLCEDSFQYDSLTRDRALGQREDELFDLQEIWEYCRENAECLQCDVEKLYHTEVEPGISLEEWLFCEAGTGDKDVRDVLLYMLGEIREVDGAGDKEIRIALGPYEDCVYTRRGYIDKRRSYLAKLGNVQEFSEFMGSCFRETVFSDEIKQKMKKIPKFRKCTEAIVSNLSLLNDQALDIYKKHNGDANAAMRELTAKAVECSGDPGHKEFLKFPFSYSEKESDGREYVKVKKITCSPHMKLIRRDSNLRIYFFWFDEEIGKGEKVLVGHIGGHPY